MRTLAPITLKETNVAQIERTILRILYAAIYAPLLEALGATAKQVLQNSKGNPLYDAILKGRVWYVDGQFKGEFNAAISAGIIKLGGRFDHKSKSYSLDPTKVPADLKSAQVQAQSRYEALRARMLAVLDEIDLQNSGVGQLKDEYEKTLDTMEDDLQKTLPRQPFKRSDNPAVEGISIAAKLTDDQREVIAKEWAENLDLYIKDWTDENILKLREQIQPHVLAGGRASQLEKTLRDNYGVAARKAKFLARQETSLLMSKFRQTRYEGLGIKKYKWSTSHDARVRPAHGADPYYGNHRALNGKIFSWDDPPVTCQATGARNHPGEDFGCRCIAIPVVE